ncbi:MAG TPA: hypothetical protein VK586_06530, partial [Streptosporangiaceae bacterium]|nr:hypothetical protein [Streptosporangiaceae bacterium]
MRDTFLGENRRTVGGGPGDFAGVLSAAFSRGSRRGGGPRVGRPVLEESVAVQLEQLTDRGQAGHDLAGAALRA